MKVDNLEVIGPSPETSFRIRLLNNDNLDVIQGLLEILPFNSFLLHVVVAGETIYCPVPSITMNSKNMVVRRRGSIYYNVTSQSICFCYGAVTESTLVNQFAEVIDEDLQKLTNLGKLVYEQTVDLRVPKIVEATITRERGAAVARKPLPIHHSTSDWFTVKQELEQESAVLRLPEEPDDIKTVRLGATATRAGSESSSFQPLIFLQGFLSTLGPHVFSRLLTISKDPEMSLPLMIRHTRAFLTDTFNIFDFLGDLGLSRMIEAGNKYEAALGSLNSLEDYRELTDSMRTLVQLYYRWLHLVFPWYLKSDFPSRTPGEIAGYPKLKKYQG